MKKFCVFIFIALFITTASHAAEKTVKVAMDTVKGEIILELDKEKAPDTVENFLSYVKDGFYNGTVFHRVIKGFMIQGGGFTASFEQKKTRTPIKNEADNGLKNTKGAISMARTSAPHSATSQFFINTVDNTYLNHKSKSGSGWGYCVFGKVVKGMETVEAIENTATSTKGMMRDVPIDPIIIKNVRILE